LNVIFGCCDAAPGCTGAGLTSTAQKKFMITSRMMAQLVCLFLSSGAEF
jgi:hypothetical protein